MSRPLRIEFENAYYHVMHYSVGRRAIFDNNQDRELFFELLEHISQKFKIEIYAYCLMSNHYHLLIKTPLANLQQAMRSLNSIYALRHNRNKKLDGQLFRGRYKAIVVEENYLVCLTRYIHLIPVINNVCKQAKDYQWSSYLFYVNHNLITPSWLLINKLFLYSMEIIHQITYEEYVAEGVDNKTLNFYKKFKNIPVFGSEKFVSMILKKHLNYKHINREVSEYQIVKKLNIPLVMDVMKVTACYYNVEICSLKKSRKGKSNLPRAVGIYLAAAICHQSFALIAKEFENITAGGVSNVYNRVQSSLLSNFYLRKEVEELKKIICNVS